MRAGALALGLLAGAGPAAWAATRGLTPWGMAFATGGVTSDERESLRADYADRRLWVVTAVRGSGEYLSDARVVVRELHDGQRALFERRLDGPWLFMDLPLGRYEVEVRFGDAVQRREVTVRAGDHHKLVFYFDVPDNGAGPGR
jgi:hypothetical protein